MCNIFILVFNHPLKSQTCLNTFEYDLKTIKYVGHWFKPTPYMASNPEILKHTTFCGVIMSMLVS